MPNYKVIYLKLKNRYPSIERELNTKPRPMTDSELMEASKIFCRLKGISSLDKKHITPECKDLFFASFIMLYDPDYLEVRKKLRRGLRDKLGSLINHKGSPSNLSYSFDNVKHSLNIYKDLKEEATYIYQTILEELDYKMSVA